MASENTEEIKLIPVEMLQLIPNYGGDMMQLNLFLRQCEYVISKYGGSRAQNTYVMHSIMSRLVDRAAALVSEHGEIESWADFKKLFSQHFADPRTEECIFMELQNLKIKNGESYIDFCNRVKSVRSALIAKISLHTDATLKEGKIAFYDEIALSVFIYNLPEKILTNVRIRSPKTLEAALTLALEEASFQERYNMHHKNFMPQPSQPFNKFGYSHVSSGSGQTFGASQNTNRPQVQATLFGSQPAGNTRSQLVQATSFGSQPVGATRPQQFGINAQQSSRPQTIGGSSLQFGAAQNSGCVPFGFNKPVEKTNVNSTADAEPRVAQIPDKQDEFKLNDFQFVKPESNQ